MTSSPNIGLTRRIAGIHSRAELEGRRRHCTVQKRSRHYTVQQEEEEEEKTLHDNWCCFPSSSSSSRGNHQQLGKLTIVQLNDALCLENKLWKIVDFLMCKIFLKHRVQEKLAYPKYLIIESTEVMNLLR